MGARVQKELGVAVYLYLHKIRCRSLRHPNHQLPLRSVNPILLDELQVDTCLCTEQRFTYHSMLPTVIMHLVYNLTLPRGVSAQPYEGELCVPRESSCRQVLLIYI